MYLEIILIMIITDFILDKGFNFKGNYYLIHSINNFIVVYYTFNDVFNCFTNFDNILINNYSNIPSITTYCLHIYHFIYYFKSLKFDDYLHHILMVGFCLPVGNYIQSGLLLNYSLFFLTGLPGGIDYILLFLNRNNLLIDKYTEKTINSFLNLWIRMPGCISHSTLTLIMYNKNKHLYSLDIKCLIIMVLLLVLWNGIYFMNQIIRNHEMETLKRKNKN
ncbi:hypothetical protein [Chlorella virus XW01]|nr:hypothetical protein [Chlorella virus XW01]